MDYHKLDLPAVIWCRTIDIIKIPHYCINYPFSTSFTSTEPPKFPMQPGAFEAVGARAVEQWTSDSNCEHGTPPSATEQSAPSVAATLGLRILKMNWSSVVLIMGAWKFWVTPFNSGAKKWLKRLTGAGRMHFESGQHYWRSQVESKHECQVTSCKSHEDQNIKNCSRLHWTDLRIPIIPIIYILNHNKRAMMPNAARQVSRAASAFFQHGKGGGASAGNSLKFHSSQIVGK